MRTGALYKDREDPLMTHMYIYNKGSLEFILFHVRGCSLILITTLKFKSTFYIEVQVLKLLLL